MTCKSITTYNNSNRLCTRRHASTAALVSNGSFPSARLFLISNRTRTAEKEWSMSSQTFFFLHSILSSLSPSGLIQEINSRSESWEQNKSRIKCGQMGGRTELQLTDWDCQNDLIPLKSTTVRSCDVKATASSALFSIVQYLQGISGSFGRSILALTVWPKISQWFHLPRWRWLAISLFFLLCVNSILFIIIRWNFIPSCRFVGGIKIPSSDRFFDALISYTSLQITTTQIHTAFNSRKSKLNLSISRSLHPPHYWRSINGRV